MKKVLLIALCVVMALSCFAFTSCANNNATQSAAEESVAATQSAAEESAAATESAAEGTKTIGVSMMTFEHPFFSDMLAQIRSMAEETVTLLLALMLTRIRQSSSMILTI